MLKLSENVSVKEIEKILRKVEEGADVFIGDTCGEGKPVHKGSLVLIGGNSGTGKTQAIKDCLSQHSSEILFSDYYKIKAKGDAFLEDKASFLNQTKVRDILKLIQELDPFIIRSADFLGQPHPVISPENKDCSEGIAALIDFRFRISNSFRQRIRAMHGTPKRRAEKIISELKPEYLAEFGAQ